MDSQTPKERVINGRRYEVALLPAFQGLDLLEELTVLLGPALGSLAKNAGKDGMKGKVDFEAGAVRLFSALGSGKLKALAKSLLSTTSVELSQGKMPRVLDVFDVLYAGKISEVFRVMAFALEVQFSDFYDAAKGQVLEFLAAMVNESTSPKDSGTAGSP